MMTMMIMTGISSGKRFEHNWKNSVPKDIFYYRLRDGSSSWGGNLLWCSSYQNVIAGFVIEFSELSECYFVEINQFNAFYDTTNRKSLSLQFCRENGIKIGVEKKKINSRFDIEKFLNDVKGK